MLYPAAQHLHSAFADACIKGHGDAACAQRFWGSGDHLKQAASGGLHCAMRLPCFQRRLRFEMGRFSLAAVPCSPRAGPFTHQAGHAIFPFAGPVAAATASLCTQAARRHCSAADAGAPSLAGALSLQRPARLEWSRRAPGHRRGASLACRHCSSLAQFCLCKPAPQQTQCDECCIRGQPPHAFGPQPWFAGLGTQVDPCTATFAPS